MMITMMIMMIAMTFYAWSVCRSRRQLIELKATFDPCEGMALQMPY